MFFQIHHSAYCICFSTILYSEKPTIGLILTSCRFWPNLEPYIWYRPQQIHTNKSLYALSSHEIIYHYSFGSLAKTFDSLYDVNSQFLVLFPKQPYLFSNFQIFFAATNCPWKLNFFIIESYYNKCIFLPILLLLVIAPISLFCVLGFIISPIYSANFLLVCSSAISYCTLRYILIYKTNF